MYLRVREDHPAWGAGASYRPENVASKPSQGKLRNACFLGGQPCLGEGSPNHRPPKAPASLQEASDTQRFLPRNGRGSPGLQALKQTVSYAWDLYCMEEKWIKLARKPPGGSPPATHPLQSSLQCTRHYFQNVLKDAISIKGGSIFTTHPFLMFKTKLLET